MYLLIKKNSNAVEEMRGDRTRQQLIKQIGAEEACWAHNPKVLGSKPRSANSIFFAKYTPKSNFVDAGFGQAPSV